MKKTEELNELRDKTLSELRELARSLREGINSERVESHFKDQMTTNNVAVQRKRLARILTIITEKQAMGETETGRKKSVVNKTKTKDIKKKSEKSVTKKEAK